MASSNRSPGNYTQLSNTSQRKTKNVIHYNPKQTKFEMANSCTAILKLVNLLDNDNDNIDNLEVSGDIEKISTFLDKHKDLLYTSRDFVGSKKEDGVIVHDYRSVIKIDKENLMATLRSLGLNA